MSMMSRTLTVGLVATIVGALAAADDAPQSIKAGALSFKAPGDLEEGAAQVGRCARPR